MPELPINSATTSLNSPDPTKASMQGVAFQIIASLMFAAMSTCVYAAHLAEPGASSLQVSFIRAAVNLAIILIPALCVRGELRKLFGDARTALWLRGLFGGVSLMLSFAGTQSIGVAESGFLHASNAFFVAALAPVVLGQRNTPRIWLILSISVFGLLLLLQPRFDDGHHLGRVAALFSGFTAAIAYLMIAKAGKSNPPVTIIFYFSLVSTLLHLILLPFDHTPVSTSPRYWLLAIAAGIFATFAQYFMTRAYQLSPAVINAIVGYFSPVFGLVLSVWLFDKTPDSLALIGAALIIACGVWLPISRSKTGRLAG